jgi:hypothetical protein
MTTLLHITQNEALKSISDDAAFDAAFRVACETATALETNGPRQTNSPRQSTGRATKQEMALDEAQCAVHTRAYTALVAAIDAFVAQQVSDALLPQAQA